MKKKILLTVMAVLFLAGCKSVSSSSSERNSHDGRQSYSYEKENESVSVSEQSEVQSFTKLDLEVEKTALQITGGDSFSVTYQDGSDAPYRIYNDTLFIEEERSRDILLTLPFGACYDAFKLDAEDADIRFDADCSFTVFELQIENGEAEFTGLSVTEKSFFEADHGSLYAQGLFGTSISAECEEGQINLQLMEDQDEFCYKLDLTEGEITIGKDSYHDRTLNKTLNGDKDKSMRLKCKRGNIFLEFTK